MGAAQEKVTQLIETYKKLEQINFFKSTLNREILMKSLIRLSNGESLPIPIFNCLIFNWVWQGSKYPSVVISDDVSSAITRYNRKNIRQIREILESVGSPDFYIIIPDSEIFDDKVWSFSQTEEERATIAMNLLCRIQYLFPDIKAIFCSEYCSKYGLKNPKEYTKANYEKIKADPSLTEIIIKSLPNVKAYLGKYIGEKQVQVIKDDVLLERTIWYFAMYMGEGQALAGSNAISVNFEEGTVPKWFQIGANNNLAIISPSNDIYGYYQWRNNKLKPEDISLTEDITDRIKNSPSSDPVVLYVPWGFRKTSAFGGKELSAMNFIDNFVEFFSTKGISCRVLLMTTTPYWTEVDGYDIKTVQDYFTDVKDEAVSRGYQVADWDEIRTQYLEQYFNLLEYWTFDRIMALIPSELLKNSKKSAKKISLREKELGIDQAAFIYNRERIIEAQLVNELFAPIKLSMAPSGGINDYLDLDLPRIFPLPDELSYPWWPERRIKQ